MELNSLSPDDQTQFQQLIEILNVNIEEMEPYQKLPTDPLDDQTTFQNSTQLLTDILILNDKKNCDSILISIFGFIEPNLFLALLIYYYLSGIETGLFLLTRLYEIAPYVFTKAFLGQISKFIDYCTSTKQKSKILSKASSLLSKPKLQFHSTSTLIIGARLNLPRGDPLRWTIYTIPPDELCHQLTIKHFDLFKKITTIEIIKFLWSPNGSSLPSYSPNMQNLINEYTQFQYFVSLSIILPENIKERVEIYINWLLTADELSANRNYHGFFAIWTALQHPAVFRLKKTRDQALKSKLNRKIFEKLESLADMRDDFAAYRSEVDRIKSKPAILYYVPLLKDISLIKGPQTNIIHISKCQQCLQFVQRLQVFSSQLYPFSPHNRIQELINNIPGHVDPSYLLSVASTRE